MDSGRHNLCGFAIIRGLQSAKIFLQYVSSTTNPHRFSQMDSGKAQKVTGWYLQANWLFYLEEIIEPRHHKHLLDVVVDVLHNDTAAFCRCLLADGQQQTKA